MVVVYEAFKQDTVWLKSIWHPHQLEWRKKFLKHSNKTVPYAHVATVAYAMGIDYPDVRQVVHFGVPVNAEDRPCSAVGKSWQ